MAGDSDFGNSLVTLLIILFLFSGTAFGQYTSEELFELPLDKLMQVKIVSASKKAQVISEAPAIIDVITHQDIRLRGYLSVGEALSDIPGLFVTTDHVTHNVSVRGINGGMGASSRTLKVMIDGQPVAFRSTSENYLGPELIPIGLVERIEVIRGPASALYGANAFLGVVNIITKMPDTMDNLMVSYGNGLISDNIDAGSIELLGAYESKNKFLTVAGGFNAQRIDRSGLSIPFSTHPLTQRIDGNYTQKPSESISGEDVSRPISVYGKLRLNTFYGGFTTIGHLQGLDNDGRFYEKTPVLNTTRVNISNWFIKEVYKGLYQDSTLAVNASFAYSSGFTTDEDRLDIDHPELGELYIDRDLGCKSIDLACDVSYDPTEYFNIMFGIDYTQDQHNLLSYTKINEETGFESDRITTDGDDLFTNLGINGQGIWHFSDKGSVTGGLRFDHHNIYENNLNYRLGVVYGITEDWYGKLLYGTSFRAPTPAQLFSPRPPYNLEDGLVGNPNLVPETAQTIEISTGINILPGLQMQINGFYNRINKFVVIERSGGISHSVNFDKINSYGIEESINWQWHRLTCHANVSYQQSMVKGDNGQEDESTKLFPELMGNLLLNYKFNYLTLGIRTHVLDDYTASQNNIDKNLIMGRATSYKLDGYMIHDVSITSNNLTFIGDRMTEISLTIKNITDDDYAYPGFLGYDVPNLGRTLWFSVKQAI